LWLNFLKGAAPMPSVTALGERLKELRTAGLGGRSLTQSKLGRAFGVSVPLISSWEHGTAPPEKWIEAYARLFARDSASGDRPRVPALDDLDEAERATYRSLRRELLALRDLNGGAPSPAVPEAPNPLQYPPGEPITIACSELSERLREQFSYAGAGDPDYVESYKYADLDALLELVPHIRWLNPTNPLTVGVPRELSNDDLTAHLITLGGVDFNAVTAAALVELEQVPVTQYRRQRDSDVGGFAVFVSGERRNLEPRVIREGNDATLKEDVAHFLRAPNPFYRERTLTSFNGMHSRGSYGVVRALTVPEFQERNAAYLARRFRGADTYSIVCRVKIVADEVVVPDWTRDDIRLHEWPEAGDERSTAGP
jgi:transcriptional regulator with XRE-family HTH domain